jgi:hypothetical protein
LFFPLYQESNYPSEWKRSLFEEDQPVTPTDWMNRSGYFDRNLNSWLSAIGIKIKKFLGGVEPLNLGWLYDPLRYLTAVTIRQVCLTFINFLNFYILG